MNTLAYATPQSDAKRLNGVFWIAMLLGSVILLSLLSLVVVVLGAGEEPYFGQIRVRQALIQVGLGSVLIAFWLHWAVVVAVLVYRRIMHRAWLFALLWVALCVCYLSQCPLGYIEDIIRFQSMPAQQNAAPAPSIAR